MAEFVRPMIEEIGSQLGNIGQLRADTEQQQQQQQQQQASRNVRRFMNLESMNPEEIGIERQFHKLKTRLDLVRLYGLGY